MFSSNTSSEVSSAQEVSDDELVARIATGDRGALALLYERYSSLIFTVAMEITFEKHTAEEVLQDAFVRIWKHAASFDAKRSAFSTWALSITRNLCLDRLRAKKRRPTFDVDINETDHVATEGAEAIIGQAAIGDTRKLVSYAVHQLEPEERRCIELSYFGGLSQSEISRKLNQPLGTVKGRIRRSLLKLRETLASYEF
ncbi:sigma-70 family RNA polymerase sigma factor [Rubellicoccus peritrichatus]|uniref:Sigma-70 family RNA polymerase sigma factor n=1 Tax=Rubellicoccus peritrichatus TaxID=3080537 RepID=A0AAQ3QWF9_9BACT|nr:sigma-70 family RNA polymerase sigma factor [Puniceicoccus sp. CR14]WOO42663.1 sigma-70 family RNA polymerase sigma factor [Puniceicoccus sp. CR14]